MDKTEKPTPKKLGEAREEGQLPRSQDLGAWAGVLAGCLRLPFTISLGKPQLASMFERIGDLIGNPRQAGALAPFDEGARTTRSRRSSPTGR